MGQRFEWPGNALDENFYLAATELFAMQPGLDDAGVVEYEQVARINQVRQVEEQSVIELAGIAFQVKQATSPAFLGGKLGNQVVRQEKIEISSAHCHKGCYNARLVAGVAELVDAADSKSAAARCGGSSPPPGTSHVF